MRNHSTPIFLELVSTAGKNPTLTPSTSTIQSATFLLQGLKTGIRGRMWNYATSIVLKLTTVIDQPASGGSAINPDKLWKILDSVSVQTPILGNLFTHQNTRGAVLGNIIQRFGFGYWKAPTRAAIASTDGDTTVVLYYRIPFAYEYLRKPHETSPWVGFLEGGTVEAKLALSTVLDGDSTGVVTKATTSMRCWLECIPAPEAVIHTPTHWREHVLPGSTTRHMITDIGSPDGLNGVDMSKGCGLATMLYLTDATGIGLSGADGTDNITGYDIPWRDQDRIDCPDAAFMSFFAATQGNQHNAIASVDGGGWPYTIAATVATNANDAQALFFPFVVPGRDFETSKMQSISGSKEINVSYTSTPSGSCRLLAQYYPQFDEQFIRNLAARINPNAVGELTAKTLNKQAGGVRGVGKLAYTRTKVR